MQLARFKDNPILSPSKKWWEINATFNPGATKFQGKILLLYRAIGGDGLSRFGLAESSDGVNFARSESPTLEADPENPYERLGIEDPRISKIGDTYYIVYTAASVYPAAVYESKKFAPSVSHPAPWRVRPSLITTRDFKKFERKGILLDKDTKDACLFPEKIEGYFVLMHRIYPNIYLSYSKDLKSWEREETLLGPREGFWDAERVGAGAPPIKTEQGWLVFYHGVDSRHFYSLGTLLLDLNDPNKVLDRSDEPVLYPEKNYELWGLTPNVVFCNGVVEFEGEYLIYYGAADKVIGLAKVGKGKVGS